MGGQASDSSMTRRGFLGAAAVAGATGAAVWSGLTAGQARAATMRAGTADQPVPLTVAAESPWQVNQVGLTDCDQMFVSGPRYISPTQVTPSLARKLADGTFVPFPGNSWNDWKPGDSGLDQFVNVITLNVFWDNTVWVCDWGAPMSDSSAVPVPGAQKVVQLDPVSGRILDVLRFNGEILPAGSQLNDLQINGDHMYIADSGLGGIIYHNMSTGKTLRRLSGYPEVTETAAEKALNPPPPRFIGAPPGHSDSLHCTADGIWLYWAPPQGPIRRCRTDLIRDASIPDAQLATHVEFVANILVAPGLGMDTLGNIYLSDPDHLRFDLLPTAPGNAAERTELLPLSAPNPGMNSPDTIFIDVHRRLYAACSQFSLGSSAAAPWQVFSMALPETYNGYKLGNADDGRPGPATWQ